MYKHGRAQMAYIYLILLLGRYLQIITDQYTEIPATIKRCRRRVDIGEWRWCDFYTTNTTTSSAAARDTKLVVNNETMLA